jgi:NAD(P)-dependent dehydrogenase (short-subunit alcohol dehydrogenase family)
MIPLKTVREHNAAIVQAAPLVAVCIGGTDGIGECAVRALADTHGPTGKGLRVYIVGRSKAKADKIIADCTEACPPGQFIFVQAKDLGLLKDVDKVCAEIVEAEKDAAAKAGQLAKIDLLVLTQGILSLSARKGTVVLYDFHMLVLTVRQIPRRVWAHSPPWFTTVECGAYINCSRC